MSRTDDNGTQKLTVLNYLKTHKYLTSMDAFHLFGATRLSAIVFELRKAGHDIKTTEQTTTNRYGTTTNYARYTYIEYNGLDNTIRIKKLRGEQ